MGHGHHEAPAAGWRATLAAQRHPLVLAAVAVAALFHFTGKGKDNAKQALFYGAPSVSLLVSTCFVSSLFLPSLRFFSCWAILYLSDTPYAFA